MPSATITSGKVNPALECVLGGLITRGIQARYSLG